MKTASDKLTDAEGLRMALWDKKSRPGLRTIRRWTAKKAIPFIRIGGSIFFDPEQVRAAFRQCGQPK